MNVGWIVLLVCAGGYVLLALYGKYRTIREQFEEARDEQALAAAAAAILPTEEQDPGL